MTISALRESHAICTVPDVSAPAAADVDVKALVLEACERWLALHPGKNLTHFADAAGVPYTGGLMRWRGVGGNPEAVHLVKVLRAAGMLNDQHFSIALSLAAQLVRRLDGGERLPPQVLLALAEETEQAGKAAHRFAVRLRREAKALG